MMRYFPVLFLIAALLIALPGCALSPNNIQPVPSASPAEDDGYRVLGTYPTVSTISTAQGKNTFAFAPTEKYNLYAYNAPLLGYTDMGFSHFSTIGVSQPELEAAVAAINALPALEIAPNDPSGRAKYGLLSVSSDSDYSKKQFFLYEDTLMVNGVSYRINKEQYKSLKAVMEKGAGMSLTAPHWFVYMNPNRVTGIQCTDQNGKAKKIKKENVELVAAYLRQVNVKSAKTYKPGSKNLDKLPYKAVYTFDNGTTYTVYVSDTTSQKGDVVFYVEASDMSFACQYMADGYISSYIEYTQEAISGPVNPPTM